MDDVAPGIPAFDCSITLATMEDPVMAIDGLSYERNAITHWLRHHETSPMTRVPMTAATLVGNRALKDAIEQWRSQQPLALDPDNLIMCDPEEFLGEGSFGKVVKGTLRSYGRELKVAVKMLPAMTRAEQKSQFDKEIKVHLAAQQRTDGVCKLLHTCEQGGKMCLVMKLYHGSLADKIAKTGPLTDVDVRCMGHRLCQTLVQLHEAGVIVQDIKPENILLDQYDAPVFSDFGISDVIQRSTRIMPTSVKGTFNYMAPEKFNDECSFGVEVDIWSMGCVLLEMHTGQAPWNGMQMQHIYVAVAMKKRVPEIPSTIPMDIDLLKQCFAFEHTGRPTAARLVTALQPVPTNGGDRGLRAGEITVAVCTSCTTLQQKYSRLQQKVTRLQQELTGVDAERTQLKREVARLQQERTQAARVDSEHVQLKREVARLQEELTLMSIAPGGANCEQSAVNLP
jgi:hypothetical protein